MALSIDLTTISDEDLATLTKDVQTEQERRTILTTAATRLKTLLGDYINAGGTVDDLTITQTATTTATAS